MATNYHKMSKRKLTMRQAARVNAESTIRTIVQAFDQVRASKTRVIDPVSAEIDVAIEYLQNHKKSPFVTEEMCGEVDVLLKEIDRVKELFGEIGKLINRKAVEIDAVLSSAAVVTDKVLELVRNGVPKDGTHEAYKDELLFLEVEHTGKTEEAINRLNEVLNSVSEATGIWASVSKRISKYSNLETAA